MYNISLTKTSIEILKDIKNKNIINIYYTKKYNNIYGEIFISTDDSVIKITNYENFIDDEDFPLFIISTFNSSIPDGLEQININDKLKTIEIINEDITKNDTLYAQNCICITFVCENKKFSIYKDWLFSEIININFDFDYSNLRTIEDTIEDWSQDDFIPISITRNIEIV